MFDATHYVPILKGRDGEYGALQRLEIFDRQRLTPLIEIPPLPWNYEKKAPQKTVDLHVEKVSAKLLRSWGQNYNLFVDTLWLASEKMNDGSNPLTHILGEARALGLRMIPVTGLLRDPEHVAASREAHSKDGRGVCIRLLQEDLSDKTQIESDLQGLLALLKVGVSDVDLLLDLRFLPSDNPVLASTVIDIIQNIPWLSRWRTFTLSGTSFPSTLAHLSFDTCSYISRLEWDLWTEVRSNLPRNLRQPTFSDYAIAHPEHSEVDPRIMKASAAIRYTSSNSWVVVRGRGLKKHKYDQFHNLSLKLTKQPEYKGKDFSWGDSYIEGCGRRVFGTGNLTTWRKAGTSHHVAFVLDQLASLFASEELHELHV